MTPSARWVSAACEPSMLGTEVFSLLYPCDTHSSFCMNHALLATPLDGAEDMASLSPDTTASAPSLCHM